MNLQVVYCNHQTADLAVRERLAFSPDEKLVRAYHELRQRFPNSEHVVISTCNRVELYSAQEDESDAPSRGQLAAFFADFHKVPLQEFFDDLL
ncbi:MAG: glutamyl-tRNA reductase, partial [Planctomycetaceae bacterium]|nr:glutamyl-tRNA reductase [Planctomycetaceae bacterium]